jgi:hypothetical protein
MSRSRPRKPMTPGHLFTPALLKLIKRFERLWDDWNDLTETPLVCGDNETWMAMRKVVSDGFEPTQKLTWAIPNRMKGPNERPKRSSGKSGRSST